VCVCVRFFSDGGCLFSSTCTLGWAGGRMLHEGSGKQRRLEKKQKPARSHSFPFIFSSRAPPLSSPSRPWPSLPACRYGATVCLCGSVRACACVRAGAPAPLPFQWGPFCVLCFPFEPPCLSLRDRPHALRGTSRRRSPPVLPIDPPAHGPGGCGAWSGPRAPRPRGEQKGEAPD
jgi:hypothetical protein